MSKLNDKAIVIIGGGPAGYMSALELRKRFSEQKIILIEKNKLGGACLHVGCIPSKQLHSIENLADFPKLITKNKMMLEKAIASELKAADIEVIIAEAQVSEDGVVVDANKIDYCKLIIATGTKPRTLKEFPDALTSDSFFSEESLAKGFADKYLFIGGGYIGLELASMLAHHGKQVRVIEMMNEIMPFLDKDIHAKFMQGLKTQKIKVETGVKDLSSIQIEEGEEVFVSIGREASSFKPRTSNQCVIGDASGQIALAHYAYAQAKQLAASFAGEHYHLDPNKVPLVVFTHPELASIGLTEQAAREIYGAKVETRIINWASNGKARVSGHDRGMTKWVIVDNHIVGCHIIGHSATDLISIVVPIINMNPSIEEMKRWIYPHPTLGEIFSF
ncbi:MAG: FAD-dependent oxidoreductase [Cyanobacteria bacterium]|nr:FAD-dependent oxidoreductase [Cyanobacteriota bacterium]